MKEEDPERLKEIASKGGRSSHGGGSGISAEEGVENRQSSARGFAKMKEEDPQKLHQIASKGGQASAEARREKSSENQ